MDKECHWCNSHRITHELASVYWELPDGTRAIEIRETPTIFCYECNMNYQDEEIVREIENQLFLIDTKELAMKINYQNLMEIPRLLKRNYFDFLS